MEGILLIGLISVGGLGLLTALAFLFHGFVKKRSENVKTGFLLLILPGICAAIIFWWYGAIVPEGKQRTQMQLSGTYVAVIPEDGTDTEEMLTGCYKLTLFPDGCFKLDDTPGLSYSGSGTWDTEWIDGQFVLYAPEKTIIATGMPSDYEITINGVIFRKSAPCQ
ncbi:MAG TPA: hypothetical protein DIW47_05795 [Bacteroidetes bacterium]|nr:hypothetical protein [Bacteroidota bacterium]